MSYILQEKEVQVAVKEGVIATLESAGEPNYFKNLILLRDDIGISDDIISDQEVLGHVYEAIVTHLSLGQEDSVSEVADMFRISIPLEVNDVKRIITQTENAYSIAEGLENNILQKYQEKIIQQVGADYYSTHLEKIKEVVSDGQDFILTKEDIDVIEGSESKLNYLSYPELNSLRQSNSLTEYSLADDQSANKVYLELRQQGVSEWRGDNINRRFEQGAEVFGYARMFEYAKPGNRHDALYAFDRIIKMYTESGLNEKRFFNNILRQTANDESEQIVEGDGESITRTAYQRLNDITFDFRHDFDTVLEAAGAFDINQLQELLGEIKNKEGIFSSIKMLQKYHELTRLLGRTELLQELESESNELLKNYVATLAFHPTIENMNAVINFWKHPERFLESSSSHTPEEVHDSKKPSNYTDMPNLDLTPLDMRDVLVEGGLDKIQAWEPLEVEYLVPRDPQKYQELQNQEFSQLLLDALGKRGKSEGKANQPKKIAKQVSDILGIQPSDLSTVINGDIIPTEEQRRLVMELIFFDKNGYNEKSERYLAKINLKSDPDGIVAGNDTKTCDPFGDGKNVLYTYNPVCASFTLQKEIQTGTLTTIGQSILTRDKDVGVNINKLLEKFEESGLNLAEEIPEEILREAESIIAADSIEVNSNFKQEKYAQIISDLYKDFFAEYLKQYAAQDNLDTTKVVTGSCEYDLANLGTMTNTFLPESPVAYSDKYREEVRVIDFSRHQRQYFKRKVTSQEKERIPEGHGIEEKNVQYLTYRDTLPTAYLEGKVYSNTSLQQGLHEMENVLIAKDINNTHKQRPNMSLKYVNGQGEMKGYLVAYEGEIGVNRYQETRYDGEKCIYVMDIAKSSDDNKAGFGLMNGFIELYKKNYIDTENPLPIFAEAREATSFKILTRQLERFGNKVGVKFEMEELDVWESEEQGDVRHIIIIRCSEA